MKKKYLNIALGVFVAVAFVSFLLSAAGMRVPGLTKISIILMMAVLVVNAIYDMPAGREKSMCMIILIIAALAIVVNVASLIMEFMGV